MPLNSVNHCKAYRRSTHHRNISNQALSDHAAQKLELEYRIVLALWRMAVLEDVQRIFPIPCATDCVLNLVHTVGLHLYLVSHTIRRAPRGTYFDDFLSNIIIKEELADMCKTVRSERALRKGVPRGKDLCVNVDRTA